jgi:hypothetical protein
MNTEATESTAFETTLEREYCKRRDSLQTHFPSGYQFLVQLEKLCETNPRFHLGTTKNLHLYIDDRFVAYITMDRLTSTAPRLFLSPIPNVDTKDGTRMDAGVLVPKPVDTTVMKHGGYKAGWAFRRAKAFHQIELVPGTPDVFFNELMGMVKALA